MASPASTLSTSETVSSGNAPANIFSPRNTLQLPGNALVSLEHVTAADISATLNEATLGARLPITDVAQKPAEPQSTLERIPSAIQRRRQAAAEQRRETSDKINSIADGHVELANEQVTSDTPHVVYAPCDEPQHQENGAPTQSSGRMDTQLSADLSNEITHLPAERRFTALDAIPVAAPGGDSSFGESADTAKVQGTARPAAPAARRRRGVARSATFTVPGRGALSHIGVGDAWHRALLQGQPVDILRFLCRGARADGLVFQWATPLMLAVLTNNVPVARLLVTAGADVDKCDPLPLFWAAKRALLWAHGLCIVRCGCGHGRRSDSLLDVRDETLQSILCNVYPECRTVCAGVVASSYSDTACVTAALAGLPS